MKEIKNLSLNTKLTLKEFIELFNSDEENELWNQFMIEEIDINTNEIVDTNTISKIVPRNSVYFK